MLMLGNSLFPSLSLEGEEVIVVVEVILNFLKKVFWYPSYRLSNPYLYPCLLIYHGPFAISESPCEEVVEEVSVCESKGQR
jgi:hypothetical protein